MTSPSAGQDERFEFLAAPEAATTPGGEAEEATVRHLWQLHRQVAAGDGDWCDLLSAMEEQARKLLEASAIEATAALVWCGEGEFLHDVVCGAGGPSTRPEKAGAMVSALTREPALSRGLRERKEAVGRRRADGRRDLWLPLHRDGEFEGAFCLVGVAGGPWDNQRVWALIDYFGPLGLTLIDRHQGRRRLRRLEEENRYFRERERRHYLFKDLVCESAAMEAVYDALHERVAEEAPILMSGEAGTGKELLARALHHLGDRQEGMLIRMDCADFPEELVEYELFGCVPDELTDALAPRKGIFELAEQGTVFLDEIDRLSMAVQGRIVRVLQEGEVRRIGDVLGRSVDARLIASSHRDLEALCEAGRFRRDLYELLMPHRLEVPPLRERREDVVPLSELFLEQFANRYDARCRQLSPKLKEHLLNYEWPGNVRQLQTVMEAAVLSGGDEEVVTREHLPRVALQT